MDNAINNINEMYLIHLWVCLQFLYVNHSFQIYKTKIWTLQKSSIAATQTDDNKIHDMTERFPTNYADFTGKDDDNIAYCR